MCMFLCFTKLGCFLHYSILTMMVVVDIVGEAKQQMDKWLGDTGSSHHIKSARAGMINVEKCPPGTKIRQVQGVVDV